MSGKLKAAAVVYESSIERDLREQRGRESSAGLRDLERAESGGTRWLDTRQMLGEYFAMTGHMESPPGIDYARDVVQGATVDRDERIHRRAYVHKALLHLDRKTQSDRPQALLEMHFRVPRKIGEKTHAADGRKTDIYGKPGVAIRELHAHINGASRDKTIAEFWEALHIVEDYAIEKGLVKYRLERKGDTRQPQVYRRDGSEG